MGSGASHSQVQRIDKSNQMPSIPETISEPRSSVSPSLFKSDDRLFTHVPHKSKRRRPSTQEGLFELDPNIEEYSAIWDHDTKLSSTFQRSSKSGPNTIEHHQRETFKNNGIKKSSSTFDSACVESTIDTQTHGYIHLSSSEKIDELIKNLNDIHTKLDQAIKLRTEQISTETESVLSHILNETHQKQQRLLNYAKEQQTKQDNNYQKVLQDYIFHLDKIKAEELAELQKQLQLYRDQILKESESKIKATNDQANIIKIKVVKDEQQKAKDKIDTIMIQIQKFSNDEKLQHLGGELTTKTNVITKTNVGTKPPGQQYPVDSEQNDSTRNVESAKIQKINKKKT